MIEEHRYFIVRCDKCGKKYKLLNITNNENTVIRFATNKVAKEVIETDGWKNMNGSFYCKECLNK